MSRIGKLPIAILDGVDVKVEGNVLTAKGPKGEESVTFPEEIEVKVEGKKWESIKMKAIKAEATEKEVEDSLLNIQKNYADYKDAETISDKNTISKL